MQIFFYMYCTQCTGHACWCYILIISSPLSTCRLVPVPATWQPGVWGPREDRVLVLLGHSVARDILLLQGQAHSQRAAGEGGWSELPHKTGAEYVSVFLYSLDAHVSFDVELLFLVPVHREAEGDEAGGEDRPRSGGVVLLPFSRQIQGINHRWVMKCVFGFFLLYTTVIFICSLVRLAPVDLWKGSDGRTLEDYDSRKSING